MTHFPRMIYRTGGPHDIHGGQFSYKIVDSQVDLDAALLVGWSMTPAEALKYDEQQNAPAPVEVEPIDVPMDAPPTRDELRRKAIELGIEHPKNIPTDKLASLVADKMKEQ